MYHTSPCVISGPQAGLFGDFICFADGVYTMSSGACCIYRLDDEAVEDDIIPARRFWYQDDTAPLEPFVDDIVRRYGVTREQAERLLDGSRSFVDLWQEDEEDEALQRWSRDAEADWDIQRLSAEAGRAMGYGVTLLIDEQGPVYFVDITKYFGLMKIIRHLEP